MGELRALDLFCGAGGASMGLHRAGFRVVGVDIVPQFNYPFRQIRADALTVDLSSYDLIWASPPCQRWVSQSRVDSPDLITPIRERLSASGTPWIIENVPAAPLRRDVMLCGTMFGLPLRRHRIFETSFGELETPSCDHSGAVVGVYGRPHGLDGACPTMLPSTPETWRIAMGIDWMTTDEMTQAIPPAYSEFIANSVPRTFYGNNQSNGSEILY